MFAHERLPLTPVQSGHIRVVRVNTAKSQRSAETRNSKQAMTVVDDCSGSADMICSGKVQSQIKILTEHSANKNLW